MTIDKSNYKTPTLYKFYPLETAQHLVFLTRAIQLGEIYAGLPRDFNDPFDCQPTFERERTHEELEKMLAQGFERAYRDDPSDPAFSRKAKAKIRDAYSSDPMLSAKDILKDAENNYLNILRNRWGVACFSDSYKKILMWSHYATKHQGICIEIPGEMFPPKDVLQFEDVSYDETRPKIALLDYVHEADNPKVEKEIARLALFTKASDWKYEGEWRAVRSNGAGHLEMPAGSVRGVILGARMGEEFKQAVIQAARGASHPVAVYQAKLSDSKYEIERELLLP